MYDTVGLFKQHKQELGRREIDLFSRDWHGWKSGEDRDGNYTVFGYVGGVRMYCTTSFIKAQGSLPKFYNNNNWDSINRLESKLIFEKLSDSVSIDLSEASVTRVDLGATLSTKFEPRAYYPSLTTSCKYTRIEQPFSVYWQLLSKIRSKTAYDKLREAKTKRTLVPEHWHGMNALRWEFRLNKRVSRQLNRTVLAQDLYSEPVYSELLNTWEREFLNIAKAKPLKFNFNNMRTPKDYMKQMALLQMEARGGMVEALKEVDQLKKQKVMGRPEYYSRLKNEIKELYSEFTDEESISLSDELELKLKEAKERYM